MEAVGLVARCFGCAEEVLKSDLHHRTARLIADVRMAKMSRLELQARQKDDECDVPIIFTANQLHRPARKQRLSVRSAALAVVTMFGPKNVKSSRSFRCMAMQMK